MAQVKAVLTPSVVVLLGKAPMERREETVSSAADRAAYISGVIPFLVSGCRKTGDDHCELNSVENVSHLVQTAPALVNQDPHHIPVIVTSSQMYWKTTKLSRQQWVSPCLYQCNNRSMVTLLAGEVERCGFYLLLELTTALCERSSWIILS